MKTTKRNPPKEDAKVIVTDFSLDRQFARQVLLGLCQYTPLHSLWVFVSASSYSDKRLRRADMDGLISMRRPQEYLPFACRYGLAAVGVGVWASSREFAGLPYADVDPVAIGEMAAEYFVDRGFRNFGMVSSGQAFHCPYRGDAFVAALRRRGLTCDVFNTRKKYPKCGEPLPSVTGSSEKIRRWLATLTKPLGVFCIDDDAGLWICEVCRRTGVHVPEEVAILGVEDDEMFCNLSHPHLSSIAVPAEQIGHEAARMMDALLRRKRVSKRPVHLPPIGVVTRQSTDVLAIDDYRVAQAVRFIQENAHKDICVDDVVAAVSLSRRTLEQRFRAAIDRSPYAEIRRVRIEKVKTLLAQTNETLEAISPKCGFVNIAHMGLTFKKATGMSPGAYRRQFRSK